MKYAISYTASLALFFLVGACVATASAAPAHGDLTSMAESGKLPPCPSMFRCSIR